MNGDVKKRLRQVAADKSADRSAHSRELSRPSKKKGGTVPPHVADRAI
jgi:hypothetical protein